jgi:hypothetical protein
MNKHLLCASVTLLAAVTSALAAAAPKDSPAKTTNRLPAYLVPVPDIAVPQSVFVTPSQPSEGRNPFFPQSTIRVVVAKVSKENPIENFTFVLNGITSPPRRTAMINGRTFEPGEEGEVKLAAGGKMLIKCEDIKSDSAVITVGGQRRELRLRSGL